MVFSWAISSIPVSIVILYFRLRLVSVQRSFFFFRSFFLLIDFSVSFSFIAPAAYPCIYTHTHTTIPISISNLVDSKNNESQNNNKNSTKRHEFHLVDAYTRKIFSFFLSLNCVALISMDSFSFLLLLLLYFIRRLVYFFNRNY